MLGTICAGGSLDRPVAKLAIFDPDELMQINLNAPIMAG